MRDVSGDRDKLREQCESVFFSNCQYNLNVILGTSLVERPSSMSVIGPLSVSHGNGDDYGQYDVEAALLYLPCYLSKCHSSLCLHHNTVQSAALCCFSL